MPVLGFFRFVSFQYFIDFGHLEEDKKDWKDQEICDAGSDCPGRGKVGVVYHVNPILQSGHCEDMGNRKRQKKT